ncbi:MAG: Crp/Fnr family transcriptional regulator [Acidobacteriota bacterium]|nr:Crp/Fnr family transcriptional regulator [Gemmatimonadota bacterium]MDH3523918.1 Crp/Fnr family transcriptional regulator [Acidobacteriota bacterium]
MALTPEEVLRTARPFSALPDGDRQHLSAVAEVRSFAAGEVILREAEPSDFLYTIVSGRVKVFKMTPSGKDIILGVFGSGDPVGSVAVFKEHPYPATAVALEDTVCIRIPRTALFSLLERYPTIARGLLLGLTQRLVELVNRVGELTGARVEPRLARLFLRLAREIGREEGGGIFVPLALSRQELSDMTGTTIETCIRVMSKWQKEDTVHTGRDGFVVLDRETLTALANS